jgi:hypothetical protein
VPTLPSHAEMLAARANSTARSSSDDGSANQSSTTTTTTTTNNNNNNNSNNKPSIVVTESNNPEIDDNDELIDVRPAPSPATKKRDKLELVESDARQNIEETVRWLNSLYEEVC